MLQMNRRRKKPRQGPLLAGMCLEYYRSYSVNMIIIDVGVMDLHHSIKMFTHESVTT